MNAEIVVDVGDEGKEIDRIIMGPEW